MSLRLPLTGLRPNLSSRVLLPSRSFFTANRSPILQSNLPISKISLQKPLSTISPLSPSLRRTFSTSRPGFIRNSYYSGGGNGWGSRPPPRGWFRRLKDKIDDYGDMRMIYAIIGLNVGIYLLWQYAMSSWTRFRDPSLYYFMQRNFVTSERNLLSGRIWTLVTSAFSQSTGSHILVNSLGLYFIAPAALSVLSGSGFLTLYLGGGLAAAVASLTWRRIRGNTNGGSEGASGAIYSALAFYGALFPNAKIYMFFILPMPVWAGLGGIFAYDMYSAVTHPNSTTDSAGHIGGILAGLFFAYQFRRGKFSGARGWRF